MSSPNAKIQVKNRGFFENPPAWVQKSKKARSLSLRAFESNPVLLRQNVGVAGKSAQRAKRIIAHRSLSINAGSRTRRNAAGRVQLDVGRQVAGKVDGIPGLFALFQREFIRGGVNLAQVVDAGILL